MKKDIKKIAARRKVTAERSDAIRVQIETVFAQMCATEPGSAEEDALADKLMYLTFTGKDSTSTDSEEEKRNLTLGTSRRP